MKSLAALFAILLLCCGGCDRRIKHGVELVLAVGTNEVQQVGAADLEKVARTIANRMDRAGYRCEARPVDGNHVSVKLTVAAVKHMGKRRTLLTQAGVLEFRLVHEESARLGAEGLVPVGYRLMKETRVMPGSGGRQVTPIIVSRQNVPGFSGSNIRNAHATRGSMNDPQVMFQFDDAGRAAFAKVTSENVGRQLAIVIDGEVYSAPMIREPITQGSGIISGGSMSDDEARDLAFLLQFPLEMPVRIVQEKTF